MWSELIDISHKRSERKFIATGDRVGGNEPEFYLNNKVLDREKNWPITSYHTVIKL